MCVIHLKIAGILMEHSNVNNVLHIVVIFTGSTFALIISLVLLFICPYQVTIFIIIVELVLLIFAFYGEWVLIAFVTLQVLLFMLHEKQVPQGTLKIFVLFFQIESTVLVKIYLPDWAQIVVETYREIICLKLFGLECIGLKIPLHQFLFLMSLPFILCLIFPKYFIYC